MAFFVEFPGAVDKSELPSRNAASIDFIFRLKRFSHDEHEVRLTVDRALSRDSCCLAI